MKMHRSTNWFTSLAAALGILAVPTLTAGADEAGKVGALPGPAPAFKLKKFSDGKEVQLLDFAGRVVVLDFFAHWCVTCAKSALALEQEIQRHYAAAGGNAKGAGVQVVSVNVEPGDRRATAAFIKKHGPDLVLNDRDGATLSAYGGASLPFLVIVDGTAATAEKPDFRVVYRHDGFEGSRKLREVIDGLGVVKGGGK